MKQAVIVIPKGHTVLSSVTGPFEILNRANDYWKQKGNPSRISVRIAGFEKEMQFDAGYCTMYPLNIGEVDAADLVIIPSASYHDQLISDNAALVQWVKETYKNGAEIASICSGAFLLAATGLLSGKTCSTHWNYASIFRRLFPDVTMVADKLITSENGIHTNGGAFSFLNLMLFLVEKYFDRDTAIWCAKTFQIDIGRTSQAHFLIFETQKNHGDELICTAQKYIEDNLKDKISFEELATSLAISRRNFDRRFIKATGNTPVEYQQRVKMEAAKRSLEKGRKNVNEVMDEVGYADDKAFREVFKKVTGLSPLSYKEKYNRGVFR